MKKVKESNINWIETKEKLKIKFALLKEDDLLFAEGNQNELLERLHLKLGKTKDEIRKIISELLKPIV